MSLKLDGEKRWKQVKEKMMKNYGVVLHFSNAHDNYHSAYQYVTKQDTKVFLSPNHPNLSEIGSPRTKTCIRVYRESRKRKQNENTNAQHEKSLKKALCVTCQLSIYSYMLKGVTCGVKNILFYHFNTLRRVEIEFYFRVSHSILLNIYAW